MDDKKPRNKTEKEFWVIPGNSRFTAKVGSLADGKKWIKDNGSPDKSYKISHTTVDAWSPVVETTNVLRRKDQEGADDNDNA